MLFTTTKYYSLLTISAATDSTRPGAAILELQPGDGPDTALSRDTSSGVGPGYTRGKDCAGLALTPSNYSNTLKAHCGFISIDLMARQTPTSSKNVCCGSQRSIDYSTYCHSFSHVSGAHCGFIPHARTISERPPEADCGLFPSIYWRAGRMRNAAKGRVRGDVQIGRVIGFFAFFTV